MKFGPVVVGNPIDMDDVAVPVSSKLLLAGKAFVPVDETDPDE